MAELERTYFGEIKSGQTVDILLDCVDIVGFGAQGLLIDIVDRCKVVVAEKYDEILIYTFLY